MLSSLNKDIIIIIIINQLSFSQARWSQCWKGWKTQNKEHGKTQHETPHS